MCRGTIETPKWSIATMGRKVVPYRTSLGSGFKPVLVDSNKIFLSRLSVKTDLQTTKGSLEIVVNGH